MSSKKTKTQSLTKREFLQGFRKLPKLVRVKGTNAIVLKHGKIIRRVGRLSAKATFGLSALKKLK